MAGKAHGGTPRRLLRRRRLPALLLLFLPVAFLPRASVVSHHHHGGSLPHVHLDASDARRWDDSSDADSHSHSHSHDYEYEHEHAPGWESGGGRYDGVGALFAADSATPHWHTQAPFLFGLPNSPPALPSIPASSAPPLAVPSDTTAANLALPFARGPPIPPLRPQTSVS
jgi:hypothetical protein